MGGANPILGGTVMSNEPKGSIEAGPEQLRYASILEKGMLVGLGILFVTFFLYAAGIIDPYIPLDQIERYWTTSVGEYLHNAGIHGGWSWLGMLEYGDFLNFLGITILAGTTIICYASIVPMLLKSKDWTYVILAVLEVIVLSTAASGVLAVGGH